MPGRNPRRLDIHLAITSSVSPSSVVWCSELGPAPPCPPMRVLEMFRSRALSLVCEVALINHPTYYYYYDCGTLRVSNVKLKFKPYNSEPGTRGQPPAAATATATTATTTTVQWRGLLEKSKKYSFSDRDLDRTILLTNLDHPCGACDHLHLTLSLYVIGTCKLFSICVFAAPFCAFSFLLLLRSILENSKGDTDSDMIIFWCLLLAVGWRWIGYGECNMHVKKIRYDSLIKKFWKIENKKWCSYF